LRAQGLVALAGGDVAAARAFLERAADAGDARALLVLGDAYDPGTLTASARSASRATSRARATTTSGERRRPRRRATAHRRHRDLQ